MAKKAPWMPFYGFDFFTDGLVRRMRRETRMVYLELLWHSWNEGAIPADTEELACILDMTERDFAKHWQKIRPAWEAVEDDPSRLVNPRLESERTAKNKVRAARKAAGETGADARWNGSG